MIIASGHISNFVIITVIIHMEIFDSVCNYIMVDYRHPISV